MKRFWFSLFLLVALAGCGEGTRSVVYEGKLARVERFQGSKGFSADYRPYTVFHFEDGTTITMEYLIRGPVKIGVQTQIWKLSNRIEYRWTQNEKE